MLLPRIPGPPQPLGRDFDDEQLQVIQSPSGPPSLRSNNLGCLLQTFPLHPHSCTYNIHYTASEESQFNSFC